MNKNIEASYKHLNVYFDGSFPDTNILLPGRKGLLYHSLAIAS